MSTSFENIVKRAYVLAAERRHELVTLEHLLAALLEQSEIVDLINALGGNHAKIQKETLAYLEEPDFHSVVKSGPYQPRHTALLLTVVKKAKAQTLFSNKSDMGSVDLLLAMFNIDNSHASYCLSNNSINRDDVLNYLKKSENPGMTQDDASELLEQYCINLNQKAKDGKIDPLIGREKEVESITQTMARRSKNNAILLGDPGVGKTIIVEGLAKAIVEGKVPETLADKVIWSLDIGSLVAGTKFRGDFEERMKQLIGAFASMPNAIMFIDEIHMIMGAGGGNQGAMDAANLLKPALSRGEIRCIGSTTNEEYRKHFEKDRALMRRFQRIDVGEPSIEDSKRILASLAPYYSKHHGISYDQEALDLAVDLSVRYIHGKYLPDKAIDVIDSAGARQRIMPLHLRAESIGVQQITEEISRIARVPVSIGKQEETDELEKLDEKLSKVVFGQDEAIRRLADAVWIGRSGLREANKTQGAFLFTGPTGVGKTEIAKQLASLLNVDFVRFDMSEFQEKHTVSKFIGSPPGYVGYGDGSAGNGMLINALEKHPHCIILCDEVEKAHPDIVSIFLQIMDNGRISSQNGKEASAQNAFLIFTSNLGATEMERRSIGFGAGYKEDAGQDAVKQWFAPEFRNRLDAVVMFNKLTKDNMERILDKFISQLNMLTETKKVHVVFDADAKSWLIDKGFDPLMGARPLSRIIHENVKKPLSKEMLFGKLKTGGSVIFKLADSKLSYDILENLIPDHDLDLDAQQLEGVDT